MKLDEAKARNWQRKCFDENRAPSQADLNKFSINLQLYCGQRPSGYCKSNQVDSRQMCVLGGFQSGEKFYNFAVVDRRPRKEIQCFSQFHISRTFSRK